jgi:hypothetical protein
MGVRVEVLVDREAIASLLADVTPLELPLGDDAHPERHFRVERPHEIALVPGRGIRIATRARLVWTIGRVPLPPVILEAIALLIEPAIVARFDDGSTSEHLVMRTTLEDLELRHLPAIIDERVVDIVNERLGEIGDQLAWGFSKALSLRFALPPRVRPLERFEIDVTGASIEVADSGLRLSVDLPMRITRSADLEGLRNIPEHG